MFKLVSVLLFITQTACITVLAPGGPDYYTEVLVDGFTTNTGNYFYMKVNEPPGLPPKGKMPPEVNVAFIKEKILKPQDSVRFADKTVWIRVRMNSWTDGGLLDPNSRMQYQPRHKVSVTSMSWESGSKQLQKYLRQHKLFKSFIISDQRPDEPFDYAIELNSSLDQGEAPGVGRILAGATLMLYPDKVRSDLYYTLSIAEKGGTPLTAKLAIAKITYTSTLFIFVPFLWGDDYINTDQWTGPVFSYLIGKAE